jgi:hypothetical protein
VHENNEVTIELQTFQKLDLEPAEIIQNGGPVTLISNLNVPSYNS